MEPLNDIIDLWKKSGLLESIKTQLNKRSRYPVLNIEKLLLSLKKYYNIHMNEKELTEYILSYTPKRISDDIELSKEFIKNNIIINYIIYDSAMSDNSLRAEEPLQFMIRKFPLFIKRKDIEKLTDLIQITNLSMEELIASKKLSKYYYYDFFRQIFCYAVLTRFEIEIAKLFPENVKQNFKFIRELIDRVFFQCRRDENIEEMIYNLLKTVNLLHNPDFFLVSLEMPPERKSMFSSDVYYKWHYIVVLLKVLQLDTSSDALIKNTRFMIDLMCVYELLGSIETISDLISSKHLIDIKSIKHEILSICKIINSTQDKTHVLRLIDILKIHNFGFKFLQEKVNSEVLVECLSSILKTGDFNPVHIIAFLPESNHRLRYYSRFEYFPPIYQKEMCKKDWRIGMFLSYNDRNDAKFMMKLIGYSRKMLNFVSIKHKLDFILVLRYFDTKYNYCGKDINLWNRICEFA